MLFNSIDFAIFLPIVFLLYWFATGNSLKAKNYLIVVASIVFYGWWDWRFLFLIFFSALLDYFVSRRLGVEDRPKYRKGLLWTSIIVNLGLLGVFKYYNFFVENFINAFRLFGQEIHPGMLNIILPVGISFYTFQTLSYTIDVYRRDLEPAKDPVLFFAYVSFFPQLVAGPIERATNLLPQFFKPKKFEYAEAVNGMRQILWGLFKKVVIADNCGAFADQIFNHSDQYSGATLFLGAVFFAIQIYGDFSGYSDIAIGTARLFGFRLMQNFAFPYFSRDIAEFWRRWHISLSTWFRDYLYIPLGGSRGATSKVVRNVFIIFIVSGFWHGASWTFIIWGALNAVYFLPLLLGKKNRRNLDIIGSTGWPTIREIFGMLLTFFLTVIAWVFFRASSLEHAWTFLISMATGFMDFQTYVNAYNTVMWEVNHVVLALVVCFILVEWFGRRGQYAIEEIGLAWNPYLRRACYVGIALVIFLYGHQAASFIYFQF